ncbi:MAG: transcriptional regulator [Bacilli bacterium]|nr:transcriptional regulator [Bacilli bacterium]
MRKLTFKTYLKQYLVDVSGQRSLNIHKLAILSKNNLRLVNPLILHCVLNDKTNVLFKYLDINKYPLVLALTKNNYLDKDFSIFEFKKIHQSYIRKANTIEYDNETKSLIRKNILKMMSDKNITNYRIYKDLKANPGNVNDYLKNNNCKKVSLKLVKQIYKYCEAY